MLELVLMLALRLPADHKVALKVADRTEITTLKEAQDEFAALDGLVGRTGEAAERHAALHLALNTLFDLQRVRADWEATGNKWEGPI